MTNRDPPSTTVTTSNVTSEESQSSSVANKWVLWLTNRAKVGIVAAWMVTLAGWAGGWHWFFDAMNHTRWHVAWACLLAALVCWIASHRYWAGTALLCMLANVFVIQPWHWYLPVPASTTNGPTIRLLYWNIHTGQQDINAVLELIEKHDPDVLAILELHPSHVDGLQKLRDHYVEHREHPRTDSFGLATYSKRPVQWSKIAGDPPVIHGRIDVETQQLQFWAIHVLPPMGSAYLRERNLQFRKLAEDIQTNSKTDQPTVVGGDFNITPWCREFRQFAADAGLVDSRFGQGYQASWPSILGWFGIPIDHVLVDPHTQVLKREVFSAGGVSDHAAVLLTVQLSSADNETQANDEFQADNEFASNREVASIQALTPNMNAQMGHAILPPTLRNF